MSWELFISGLTLGLISSFHCVGMCGAFAFALPTHHLSTAKKMMGILLYNAGRVFTYSLMGLIFGLAGRQIYLGGLQQKFSILAGVLILIIVLQTFFRKKLYRIKLIDRFNISVQAFISNYIQQKKIYTLFLIGLANGLLPCGMVYFAIAGALVAGSIGGGVEFMASFGLGTMPLMVLISYFGFMINLSVRNTMRKSVPFVMAFMGLLLILRGMNLGIPYLSPFFENTASRVVSCH